MSDVLKILEKLGQDTELKTAADLRAVADSAMLEPAVQAALLSTDVEQLMSLLQVRENVICGVFPAKEPEDEPEQQPAEQPEETPQDDESDNKALAS